MKPGETIESLRRWKWYRFGKGTGSLECSYCDGSLLNMPLWTNANHHLLTSDRDTWMDSNLWLHEECAKELGVLW